MCTVSQARRVVAATWILAVILALPRNWIQVSVMVLVAVVVMVIVTVVVTVLVTGVVMVLVTVVVTLVVNVYH